MIKKIPWEVWYCDGCETVWMPRRGSEGVRPGRCPNRGCRKLAGWEKGGKAEGGERSPATLTGPVTPRVREVGEKIKKKLELMEKPVGERSGVKKLSWEEYGKLLPSEQMRATREGKAPGR